jgi:structural maintenance of chromosome 2
LEAKRGDVERLTASHLKRKEKHVVLQSQLATSEELLQTLVTGLSSSNNNSATGGYLGQLADAKARAASAATEEEQARMRMTMVEKELKEKEAKWKAVEKEAGDGEKSLAKARKDVQILEAKLASTSWDSEKEQEAVAQIREAREQVRNLTEASSLSSLKHNVEQLMLFAS